MVIVVVMLVMMVGFLLASLVNRRALSNAIVMALPYDIGVGREGKQTFDRFPRKISMREKKQHRKKGHT